MRHHSSKRTLSRTRRGRTALIRGLAISLIEHGKVQTTEAKARELRPYIERLVTHGKNNTVASRRLVSERLGEPKPASVKKLFDVIAVGYAGRNGGYTRIIKMGLMKSGREEAVIEFV